MIVVTATHFSSSVNKIRYSTYCKQLVPVTFHRNKTGTTGKGQLPYTWYTIENSCIIHCEQHSYKKIQHNYTSVASTSARIHHGN
jgi:hypothetical protein